MEGIASATADCVVQISLKISFQESRLNVNCLELYLQMVCFWQLHIFKFSELLQCMMYPSVSGNMVVTHCEHHHCPAQHCDQARDGIRRQENSGAN